MYFPKNNTCQVSNINLWAKEQKKEKHKVWSVCNLLAEVLTL